MAQYRSRWTGEEIDDGIDKVRKIAYISVGSNPDVAINVARSSYGKVEVVAKWDDNGNEYLARCTNHALIMENVPGVGVLPYESFSFECWNSGELKTVTLSNGYNFDYDPVTGDVIGYTEYNTWSNVNTIIDVDTISFTDDNYHIPSSRLVKSAISKVAVRPNLLRNWYFVGGGSQQGGGQFPINQRGQTIYSNVYYGIDRWMDYLGSRVNVTVFSDRVNIATVSIAGYKRFMQFLGSPLPAGTYTLSILAKVNSKSGNAYLRLNNDISVVSGGLIALPAPANKYELTTLTVSVNSEISDPSVEVLASNALNDTFDLDIIAWKLELGDTQTLCHNEGTDANPVWVLNEVPDYATELLKCQTRYQLFRTQSLRPTYRQDFRPVMDASSGADPDIPNTGTITIGGVTYYYASSD